MGDARREISHLKFQIPNFRFQISNFKFRCKDGPRRDVLRTHKNAHWTTGDWLLATLCSSRFPLPARRGAAQSENFACRAGKKTLTRAAMIFTVCQLERR